MTWTIEQMLILLSIPGNMVEEEIGDKLSCVEMFSWTLKWSFTYEAQEVELAEGYKFWIFLYNKEEDVIHAMI